MRSDKEIYSRFGAKMKEVRESRRMTQTDLAKALEISQTTMYQYENGDRKVPMSFMVRFADYFDMSVDSLLETRFQDPMTETTPEPQISEYTRRWDEAFGAVQWTEEEFQKVMEYTNFILTMKRGDR